MLTFDRIFIESYEHRRANTKVKVFPEAVPPEAMRTKLSHALARRKVCGDRRAIVCNHCHTLRVIHLPRLRKHLQDSVGRCGTSGLVNKLESKDIELMTGIQSSQLCAMGSH